MVVQKFSRFVGEIVQNFYPQYRNANFPVGYIQALLGKSLDINPQR